MRERYCTRCHAFVDDPLPASATRRFQETRCPSCDHKLDSASVLEGEAPAPAPGDVMVCLQCAEPLIFEADGKMRRATAAELAEPRADPATMRMVARVTAFTAYRNERLAPRNCDHCGKRYRGPAIFCSFACAEAAA